MYFSIRSYDGRTEGFLSGELLIPRLQTEAKVDATLRKVLSDFSLQLRSSASICALSGSQNLVFTYGRFISPVSIGHGLQTQHKLTDLSLYIVLKS